MKSDEGVVPDVVPSGCWCCIRLRLRGAGHLSVTLCMRLSDTFLKLKRFKATEIVHELSNSMLSLFLVLEL